MIEAQSLITISTSGTEEIILRDTNISIKKTLILHTSICMKKTIKVDKGTLKLHIIRASHQISFG